MSEEHASPVANEPMPGRSSRAGMPPRAAISTARGIRLSTVRSGLGWQSIDLPLGNYTLGARNDADIVIDVPGVAERHCTLIVGAQHVVVKAWTNRTWINDGAVSEATLKLGDRLILGPIELRVSSLPSQHPESGMHFIAPPPEQTGCTENPLSEEEFQQLLSASGSADGPVHVSQHHAELLQELRQEITSSLQEVLRREHENREEFSRERMVLNHRTQELSQQWQQLEQVRAKLHQDQHKHLLEFQESQLQERHEELAGRSRQLVRTHRQLKALERELHQKLQEWNQIGAPQQLASIRSLLARNEAQSRQLVQRQKDLDQREESVHQQFEEIAANRLQLLDQTRQLEEEQRQWQNKCRSREKFFNEFEASLTARMQDIEEEELQQQARQQELDQRERELEQQLQQSRLQQQGVDQATRLLEQQQSQFARDDSELAEIRRQLEGRQHEQDAAARQLQADHDALTASQQQLAQQAGELQARFEELNRLSQDQQNQQADLARQQQAFDELRAQVESEREQLQIQLAEHSADQQNVQRLRNEIDAERQRDLYEREQLQQTRDLLERRQQECDHQHQELIAAREELERRQHELTFQLADIASSERDEANPTADPDDIQIIRQQLEEAQNQLQTDRSNLLEERDALERRQNQIESAREQLNQEQQQLQSLKAEIETGRQQLTDSRQELADLREQLQAERQELQARDHTLQEQQAELRRQLAAREMPANAVEEIMLLSEPPAPDAIDETVADHESQNVSSPSDSAENSEEEAAVQLRMQLANLFGMKASSEKPQQNIAAPATEIPEEEDRGGPESRFHSPVENEETPAANRPEPFTTSLPEQQDERDGPATTIPSAGLSSDDDDSIAAYMERLLARTRQASQMRESDESCPASTPVSQPAPPPRVESREESPAEISPAIVKKTRKMDEDQKNTIRHNLHSFREVANQSARTAVAKSRKTQKSSSLRNMVILNLAGWTAAVVLLVSEHWLTFSLRFEALLVAGVSLCLSVLCLYRYKEIRKLAMRSLPVEHRKKTSVDVASDPDTPESSTEKSGPLSFL